jgi:1-acyl-sn-glycerol-3-phosphate acyltransferase
MNLLTLVLDRSTVLVFSVLYAVPYLLPSEQYGGRVNTPFACVSQFAHFVLKRGVGDFVQSMEIKNKEGFLPGSIVCAHPHGALPLGFAANLLTMLAGEREIVSNTRFAVASFAFWIPGIREFYHALGCIDASRFSLKRSLDKGHTVIVCPGGAAEALYTDPAEDVALLSGRTGFIRLAFEHGASVVPAYTFGEAEIWEIVKAPPGSWAECIFLCSQMLTGLSMTLLKNFKPRPVRVKTVFGPAIKFPKVADPSPEELNRMLDLYKDALTQLYNEHRPDKKRSLRFVDNPMRRFEPARWSQTAGQNRRKDE